MTFRPHFMTGSPKIVRLHFSTYMPSDVLSNVLRTVRLTGAVFFYVEAAPPWAAVTSPKFRGVAQIMPGAGHLISYHVVTRGECYGIVKEMSPVRLEAGDVIVFLHGDPHVMTSDPGIEALEVQIPFLPGVQEPFVMIEGPV